MTPLRLIHSAAPTAQPKPSARPPLRAVKQSPCPCRDPGCRAQTMFAEGRRDYKEAGLRCLARCQANPGDIYPHEDGTWQEMTSTRGWMLVDVVTVAGVDLDSGIGDIRYTARRVADGWDIRPLPNQPGVTDRDAEFYRDAAAGQARLEDELGVGR